jgi:hypothetical protein
MALDDMIDNAVGQQAGAHTIKGLAQTRDKLVSLIESQDFAPAYREARETYKAMSRPINQMEVADDLYKKLVPAMNDFGADTRVHANAYAEALRGGDRTAQKALGYSGAKLENIMEPAQMETLQGIAKGLGNSARAAEQGMGRGSPTAQNIVSQDLLSSVVGPLGLPQKWGDSMVNTGATLLGMRPEWAKPFERMTMEELGKAAADPVLAQEMLRRGMRRSPFDRLLDSSAPYAGMLGAPIGLTQ